MKGRFFGAAVIAFVLALSVPAQAQWYGGACAKCGVISYVDIPSETSVAVVPQNLLMLAGWGFECVSGQPLSRIEFWYQGDDGYFHPAHQQGDTWILTGVYRPDVWNAYNLHCPMVTGYSGWHLYVRPGLVPVGTRSVAVVLWYGNAYYNTHFRRVTITEPQVVTSGKVY